MGMHVLSTLPASNNGDGNYVVQVRRQFDKNEPMGPWQNELNISADKAGAYDEAILEARNAIGQNDVVAARVVQVREWFTAGTFERVKA